MKRRAVYAVAAVLLVALPLFAGCGTQKTSPVAGEENGNGTTGKSDYELGEIEGYEDGYGAGCRDGKEEAYNPEPPLDDSRSDDYTAGYGQGYLQGYEKGYEEARSAVGGESETREVEEAMLAFVKENSVPGLEFELQDLVIQGEEAAAIAVCTNENLDSALVVMKKGSGGWYGVDLGTGIEVPPWYDPD